MTRPLRSAGGLDPGGYAGNGLWAVTSPSDRPQYPIGMLNICTYTSLAMPDKSLARQFLHETQARAIDASTDLEELRALAKSLLGAWHAQAEMSKHYGAKALGLSIKD